ncbi:MAG: hypothetical protein ABIF19_19685 [Planctomycetota bacterium]
MFTIDLLNGQAIPLKSKPGGLAILVVTAAIPVTFAMGMFSFYLHNNITASVEAKEIARYEEEIDKLSDVVKMQAALKREKAAYIDCLTEVKSSITSHTQWSPVLTTLIENMPNSVVLTSLEVEHDSVKKKVPKEDDPKKMVEISVPVRTLRLKVSGGPQRNCDEAVKEFMDRLSSSEFLAPRLEKIGVSQESEKIEGQDVVSYEISCVFKPGF